MISKEFLEGKIAGRYLCPECEGGSSNEKSLNIWRDGYYAMAKCHRASCGAWAKLPSYPGSSLEAKASPVPPVEVLRPYTRDSYPLAGRPLEIFKKKYGFTPPDSIRTVAYGTLLIDTPIIIPILAPNGIIRGHVFKTGFAGGRKQNIIYKAKHEPMISWSRVCSQGNKNVLLVEDQISALKYTRKTGEIACALLGTNLTLTAVSEIQRHAEHVTIALDADASAKSFRLARRYGAAFKSCQVKILERDIKDDSQYDTVDTLVCHRPGSVILVDNPRNYTSLPGNPSAKDRFRGKYW